jgi:hypothetical protein
VLVIADLLGAHDADVPTIDPSYWTVPPASARLLAADPACSRIFGIAEKSAGEPGYAADPVDFKAVRDPLGWSLAPVWGLRSAAGITPMVARRFLAFTHKEIVPSRRYLLDTQAVTHALTGANLQGVFGPSRQVGSAYIATNPTALPRVRLVGRPVYVAGEAEAIAAVNYLGVGIRGRLVVEDPERPLAENGEASGQAAITREEPECIEVAIDAARDAYLVLADTYDPGWSAALDGRAVPIRPAWITFRAVFVPRGRHSLVFRYRPAGFDTGLSITVCGLLLCLGSVVWRRPLRLLASEHSTLAWRAEWPRWGLLAIALLVLASTFSIGPSGIALQSRWNKSLHHFTWGAGIDSMKPPRADSDGP